MLHPLLLPSLLNASLTATSPNAQTTAPTKFVYCWPQQPPQEQQLIPTTYIPCKAALTKIPMGSAGLKPVSFGRSAEAGFQVPHSWNSGNCAVEIDVTDDNVVETASFAELLITGFDIAVECVIRGEHLGGRAVVGEGNGLNVWIYGFDKEDEA